MRVSESIVVGTYKKKVVRRHLNTFCVQWLTILL